MPVHMCFWLGLITMKPLMDGPKRRLNHMRRPWTISLDEQNATAYMVFANVYVQTEQFKKAATAQEKALSLDPADSYINALYGMYLYNVGKFKACLSG